MILLRPISLVALTAALLGSVSCSLGLVPACYWSRQPGDAASPALRHYPVARQGKLTAWLTSNHRRAAGDWLYAPNDSSIRHRIVGTIGAEAMPSGPPHDGALLLTADYTGPIFPLWEGNEATGLLYGGDGEGWIPVALYQAEVLNTWVKLPARQNIGGWSGFPIVIGDPARPEFVAGAMWYRSNDDGTWGGAASTRLLKYWAARLRFADFVAPEFR